MPMTPVTRPHDIASPIPSPLTPGPSAGPSNRMTQWPSPMPSQTGRTLTGGLPPVRSRGPPAPDMGDGPGRGPPMSPSDNEDDIPIALSPGPQRLSTSSPPPAAPIAGSARTTLHHRPQSKFLEAEPERLSKPPRAFMPFMPEPNSSRPRAVMPFMPEPNSPPPPSAKWSRVRELRASLKPSRRLPQPLPSPSVYDGFDAQPGTPPPLPTKPENDSDIERGAEMGEAKRKTLFQRAIEGWWDLPGLLGRSDTVRGKVKPFPSTRAARKPPGEFI